MASKGRPAKRTKLLSDDSGSDSEGAGVPLTNGKANGFGFNEEYANRFEHNKRREEKHRLEDKYKATGANASKRKAGPDNVEDDDSSSDETEDDDAELATADLDDEILETLQAIKRKDPRVYDSSVQFYRDWEKDGAGGEAPKERKEKAMNLQDYHRRNLLAGNAQEDEEDALPQTYQQEQDALRKEMVGQMHGAGGHEEDDSAGEESEDADEFFQKKHKQKHDAMPAAKSRKKQPQQLDVVNADKDPENFLSNFMAARAWLPTDGKQFAELDEDDSEEDKRADAFEEAYNMRFEDPKMANEKLQSFARDVGKYSVRRDAMTARQKAREAEREKKDEAKRERDEERARLRRLKIDDVEQKVSKIKEVAGLKGKDINLEDWRDVLEGDWDDDRWEAEMKRRFGDAYYAEIDGQGSDVDMGGVEKSKKSKKVKKPTWDDDLDIKDLVPDFQDEGARPDISVSSEDEAEGGAPLAPPSEDDVEETSRPKKKTKKDREREATEAKRTKRKERQRIEQLVDATLPASHPEITGSTAATTQRPVTGFRYRETSPTTFGMNARDILFADDTALNEYVGLKKLAAWRDQDKKKLDKKRFSKKQRLRQWRLDTFGDKEGPKDAVMPGGEPEAEQDEGGAAYAKRAAIGKGDGGVVDGERKKKRKRSKKGKGAEVV